MAELLTAKQIAELYGSSVRAIYSRRHRDPSFPKPVGCGNYRNREHLFHRDDVAAWLATVRKGAMLGTGAGSRPLQPRRLNPFDELATAFIRGQYDPACRQQSCLQRRLQARQQAPKTQTVRTEGDWS